ILFSVDELPACQRAAHGGVLAVPTLDAYQLSPPRSIRIGPFTVSASRRAPPPAIVPESCLRFDERVSVRGKSQSILPFTTSVSRSTAASGGRTTVIGPLPVSKLS